MAGTSKLTKAVAFRLKNDIHAIIARRAERQRLTVNEYLRRKAEYDATRPH